VMELKVLLVDKPLDGYGDGILQVGFLYVYRWEWQREGQNGLWCVCACACNLYMQVK